MLKKTTTGNFFVATHDKIYGCEFILVNEELWIYFIENAETKYYWGFTLLKLLINCTAVNLFKTKKSYGFISLKMLK